MKAGKGLPLNEDDIATTVPPCRSLERRRGRGYGRGRGTGPPQRSSSDIIVGLSVGVVQYRNYSLNYTIDLYCGMKFRHAVGFLICSVGLKYSCTGTVGTVLRTQVPET